jgi:hypothetical protein
MLTLRKSSGCSISVTGILEGPSLRAAPPPDWLKMKNANASAVKREEEEDWGKRKWR